MIPAFSTMALTHIAKRKIKTVSIFLVQPSSSATISHCLFLLLKQNKNLLSSNDVSSKGLQNEIQIYINLGQISALHRYNRQCS